VTRGPARWPLRRTLVAATVALVALASLVIGLVAVLSVQSLMVKRVDEQLDAAIIRSSAFVTSPDGQVTNPASLETLQLLTRPGQAPGTFAAVIADHVVYSPAYLKGGDGAPITDLDTDALLRLRANGPTQTINLGPTLGDYRLLAVDIVGGGAIVVGLPLADTQQTVRELVIVVVAVTIGILVLAAGAALAFVRLALRPLDRVTSTASEVSSLKLDRGDVALSARVPVEEGDEQTEAGLVATSINRMLGHISQALAARQASENKVRAFVSDASHELRTPLASIRGYAELTRMSGEELPPDASHALGRIESEAKRMTTIVEDLLLLARLDEGRELAREPILLNELLENAVSDARAAAPDHEWSTRLPDSPVIVAGDAHRLYEVVANLLANARVHTPAGTKVDVSLATTEGTDDEARAVIVVRDDGPGIDPGILGTVFERFVRGDASRARATGSTGLGLAIVAAVVDAHGGSVTVESEPGRTQFRIELPVTTPAPASTSPASS